MPDEQSQPATKADIRNLDQELPASVQRLVKEIRQLRTQIRKIKDTLAGVFTKKDVKRILDAIDSFDRFPTACGGGTSSR